MPGSPHVLVIYVRYAGVARILLNDLGNGNAQPIPNQSKAFPEGASVW